jgi:toxin ParE1/3/4
MTYRVELAARAIRDLRRLYLRINAVDSAPARAWFNGLEQAILGLDEHPARHPIISEDDTLRHLLYGGGGDVYRIIYGIDPEQQRVTVLHIRHGARRPMEKAGGT